MEEKRLLISLYEGCQYHCSFCMYGYVKENHPLAHKDTMSEQQWYHVLSKAYAHGFRVLEIGGRGEPTLNPVFTKVVLLAHNIGYQIELLSNALNDKAIIAVLPQLRKLTINLNAVDEAGMTAIHQPAPGFTFERSVGLVRNVLRAIGAQHLKIELKTNYVVTKQSLKEAFSFPEKVNRLLIADTGIERGIYISYQHVHNYIKTPKYLGFDYDELQKVLLFARLHAAQKALIKNTNLKDFIDKTEVLIKRLEPLAKGFKVNGSYCSDDVNYTCDVHKYVLFIDGNGDSYGCYNPFRSVNGLSIEKDPFYFGNLMSQSFEEVFSQRQGFNPLIDISKSYWRPCLLCKAQKRCETV